MSFNLSRLVCSSILRGIHTSRLLKKTHYEVLKLPTNCTPKEIKESFIKLSKEYHPDSKKIKSSENFVQLVEAYNILSKPESRRSYDLSLPSSRTESTYRNGYEYNENISRRSPWDDPSLYRNRDKSKDEHYAKQPYYGVKGIQRVSNRTIVLLCAFIGFTAMVFQMALIRYSTTLKRQELIKISNENETILSEIRSAASTNGNAVQIERMKDKMRNTKYVNYKDD